MSDKKRYPRELALVVAGELIKALHPSCERYAIAGSLRRGKADVGDLELLFIPRIEDRPIPGDMFGTPEPTNLAEAAILDLERRGILSRRENASGGYNFGPQNKLMRHCETGLPVDLFTANRENWFNYLVCRTGSAESNLRVATAAKERGWKWNPYGSGFTRESTGESYQVTAEEHVFTFCGLPALPPEQR
jgi:DNA polymerase/3'-5' exonuclease PolX